MVKARQTAVDFKYRKLKNLKRRRGVCRRPTPTLDYTKLSHSFSRSRCPKNVQYELPDYTQWFDIDSINCIEEECADNIFIGYGHDRAALHEVYKKVRNKIVELYRIEPTKFLTVTDCIRRLGMDASIVMKVHSLLNYWGIINYQATNSFGERIFNKKLNEAVVDLKGNQSNIHKKRVKLNFNQILDKDSTEPNVNTYYNDHSYNNFTKCQNCSNKRFDFNSIEDVVRYSSELNSGHYGMNLNHPRCSGCRNPCKTSYYILGPDSLGEVNNTIRNRGIWCSLCYCNSNYPITLSKDSFVRIDIPPRLSETISKLFQNNRNLFNHSNILHKLNSKFDSRGNRLRESLLKTKKLNSNLSKNRISTNKESNQYFNKANNADAERSDDTDKHTSAANDGSDNANHPMEDGEASAPQTVSFISGVTASTANLKLIEKMKDKLSKINLLVGSRDGSKTNALNSPVMGAAGRNVNDSDDEDDLEEEVILDDDSDCFNTENLGQSPYLSGQTSNETKTNEKPQSSHHSHRHQSVRQVKRARRSGVRMPWTNEDFERLYEAIRKYGTDWQSVAQHLGEDSTPNECVFQFINAPLEKEVTSKLKLTTYMDPPASKRIGPHFPFFDSPNTIVTLLSFCASVVSPVVASYAAKAAFNTIINSMKTDSNATNHDGTSLSLNSTKILAENHTNPNLSMSRSTSFANDVTDSHNQPNLPTASNSIDTTLDNSASVSAAGGSEELLDNGSSHSLNDANKIDTANSSDNESKENENGNADCDGKASRKVNKLVDGSTLQLAAAAALSAAATRAGELAHKEEEKLSMALPRLISLKIKRITEKLNRYSKTQEQLKTDQHHLEREILRTLKHKGFFPTKM